jgi:hypothetical protein
MKQIQAVALFPICLLLAKGRVSGWMELGDGAIACIGPVRFDLILGLS